MVLLGLDGDQPRGLRGTDQPHGFPGNAQASLVFRADGDPFHERAEGLGQENIPFVPSVKPHLLPQQTLADSDTQLGTSGRRRCRVWGFWFSFHHCSFLHYLSHCHDQGSLKDKLIGYSFFP